VTVLEDLAPPPKVEVWLAAIAALEGLPYATILPGHRQPGDRGPYGDTQGLTHRRARRRRRGRRPQPVPDNSVPGYGGTTMQRRLNYFLYPSNR